MADTAAEAQAEARAVVDAANTIIATMKRSDATTLARGLVVAAAAMAGDDPVACSIVGKEMVKTGLSLDPDLHHLRMQ